MEIREKITDREVKYTGRIIEVEKVTAVLPNGKVVYRDVVRQMEHRIVALDEDMNIVLENSKGLLLMISLLNFLQQTGQNEEPLQCAIRNWKKKPVMS
jgi:hypothetical protein